MRTRTMVAAAGVAVSALLLPASASATITPVSRDATGAAQLASVVSAQAGLVTGASFVTVPPNGDPNATSTTPLASFPTDGPSYAIMTSGDAKLAELPNTSPSSGADDGGLNARGDTDYDVTILKIDLAIPANANCLQFDFRFLSEEYPEFVNTSFNDAFIAELDTSNWSTSGSTITAPNNFAFDPSGGVISINTSGAASMSAAQAAGTTYDGATPLLRAATPITSGAHSLYLSIFDQGDAIYDSAVFLDNLKAGTVAAIDCQKGATPLSTIKTADSSTAPTGASDGYTITVSNPSTSSFTLNSISDTLPVGFSYTAGSTTGVTTSDPTISGQTLTWTGPFNLPGSTNVSLRFLVTVSSTPGDYFNNAGAQSSTLAVAPTGPTAKITVTSTTAVTIQSFVARRAGKSVVLRWRTASETGLVFFNVYVGARRVNRAPIVAVGAPQGSAYVLRVARTGAERAYRLQGVTTSGARVWFGTARA